jgi:hypothetical protein
MNLRFAMLAVAGSAVIGSQACAATPDDSPTSSEDALASGVHVLTQHNDVARTGANLKEKLLSPSTVSAASFGKIFSRDVDGQVYAQPLYVGGVMGGKNVVYVATEHNSVYAFDADGGAPAPLWQVNLGASVPSSATGCGLLSPEIGITSTPVIDLPSKTMWVEAKTKEGSKFVHRLHALDIESGAERANSPVVITATFPGSGAGSVGGILTLDPLKHMNRPGLLKVGNTIYMAFASNCDIAPYHGWVLAYDATTLQQSAVHVATPDGAEGGIWHGGVGLASDASGDVYYVAGNGDVDGATNFGESIVRLKLASGKLNVASWFSPSDADALNSRDLDIGSTGALLLPGTNLAVAGGKGGTIYVVDRTTMGGQVDGDGQIAQKLAATTHGMFGGFAVHPKSAGGGTLFVWGTGDVLKGYSFGAAGTFDPSPKSGGTTTGYPGGQVSVSADGDTGGVVWTLRAASGGPGLSASPGAGILQAFEAANVGNELYSSSARASDALGNIAKFAAPTIANGRVYVGTASGQLVAYGLTAGGPPDAGAPDVGPGRESGVDAAGVAPTFTQLYNTYLGPGTPGHCNNAGCHASTPRGGFLCGTTKSSCYAGLVSAGLVTPGPNAASSPLGSDQSPLAWFGGGMPLDDPSPNDTAAAAVTAWLAAGALNN